jgi:signal transduction histidine kinase
VRLINDILDIDRIEAGRVTMQKVRCRSDELVAQAIESMRGQADTAGGPHAGQRRPGSSCAPTPTGPADAHQPHLQRGQVLAPG